MYCALTRFPIGEFAESDGVQNSVVKIDSLYSKKNLRRRGALPGERWHRSFQLPSSIRLVGELFNLGSNGSAAHDKPYANGRLNLTREVDVCSDRDALFALSRGIAKDVDQSNSGSDPGGIVRGRCL